ncbi:MAG: NADH:ubiquinone reductase (Na(+)-transporting) subunit B [Acidobacteria bacterium]|nr:NADH:ubiquinone reductase (Na(+)-transporting) subunit B [Acidobacteriota bacterium]|tara:strand:- start:5358 stop:6578 length:1221 start_codon:yes stop_codon:yes gene_type:complete
MKFLRDLLDRQAHHFEKGGRLERLYPLWEAQDTFLYTPGEVTREAPHVRDALDMKRLMVTVVIALGGCIAMALYNTGYQAHLAIAAGTAPLDTWQTGAMVAMGLSFDPADLWACLVHGALYFVPVLVVTFAVGGLWEVLFAMVRGHEINEGMLVTGMLFPLTLPATVPLWQVALGITFGIVVGKEIFGGTGMNVLNPALTGRAFLFFAYPAQLSGDAVWVAAQTGADGYSGATILARATESGLAGVTPGVEPWQAFIGLVPGSMGETSVLACLVGAAILVATGIGSWRIMVSVTVGTLLTALLLNTIGSVTNPFFEVTPLWHFLLGGWAFGTVYMATDPVSGPATLSGHYVYGFLIGFLVVLIRVVNPAYPEGMMLAILFMNLFAPLIDYAVVQSNVRRRSVRHAG